MAFQKVCMKLKYSYDKAILAAFEYLLGQYPEVFVIGQGLWSPWYVGNSMTDLDKKFGPQRVIDTPVAESASTGIAVGASLAGMKPIVVHPRMDFMLYAMDAIVNEAAKWAHMTGGQASPGLTIRAIINRGGEQGAQHSQALHAWFAHVPGLRVVMPATVADARDLLIASVLCPDPVMFIDDRWSYDQEDELGPIVEQNLVDLGPQILRQGNDITLVASGYSTRMVLEAASKLMSMGAEAEVIDLRILNPFNPDAVCRSVEKTGRVLVVDGGWPACGMAGEVIASVMERISLQLLKKPPVRLTLPSAPAPTSRVLEQVYYPTVEMVITKAIELVS